MEIVDFLNHIKDWQENILKDLNTLIDLFRMLNVWMVFFLNLIHYVQNKSSYKKL